MAPQITPVQSGSTLRVGENKNSSTSQTPFGRASLSVGSSSSNDTADTRKLSVDKLAEREVNRKLFRTASALNEKEALVDSQLQAVNDLLDLARQIQAEPASSTKAEALADTAEEVLEEANNDYDTQVADKPSLSQAQDVLVTVDASQDVNTSSRTLTTSIPGAPSLSGVGLSSSLSFSSANIETTITQLEGAAGSLRNVLSGYDNVRSNLSLAASTQGAKADHREQAAAAESPEEIAGRLADQITQSADSLLANTNVEQLDVETLLNAAIPAIESRTNIDDLAGARRDQSTTDAVDDLLS